MWHTLSDTRMVKVVPVPVAGRRTGTETAGLAATVFSLKVAPWQNSAASSGVWQSLAPNTYALSVWLLPAGSQSFSAVCYFVAAFSSQV